MRADSPRGITAALLPCCWVAADAELQVYVTSAQSSLVAVACDAVAAEELAPEAFAIAGAVTCASVQDNKSHRPAVQPDCFTQSVMRIIDLSECCWKAGRG